MFNEGKAIIFLTNNSNTLSLFEWLRKIEDNVILYDEKIYFEQIQKLSPAFIISYNYKYIVSNDIIKFMKSKIINLHCSYLPYNRGSNPNFWSFIDDTPKGVTIHQMSEGIDEGDILFQKELFFDATKETFVTSYNKLQIELQKLFRDNWNNIKTGRVKAFEQIGEGSYHSQKDFLEFTKTKKVNWDIIISEYIKRICE